MFKWFQSWRRSGIPRWLSQSYDPLFAARDSLEGQLQRLTSTLEFLTDLQKELRKVSDKTDQQIMKERWQALKLNPVLEHYRLAIELLNKTLVNMPQRPDKPKEYLFDFFNGSDNDL